MVIVAKVCGTCGDWAEFILEGGNCHLKLKWLCPSCLTSRRDALAAEAALDPLVVDESDPEEPPAHKRRPNTPPPKMRPSVKGP